MDIEPIIVSMKRRTEKDLEMRSSKLSLLCYMFKDLSFGSLEEKIYIDGK